MPYLVSVTKKGQMTLPKDIREMLTIIPPAKVLVDFNKETKSFKIESLPDIMDLAGKVKVPAGKSALKARKFLEKRYRR